MWKKYLKVFIGIAVILTLVNWGVGFLIVQDELPLWTMLLANPPFGYVYVWTESLWQGEGYKILGEEVVMRLQLGALIAQIFLYYGAWLTWNWYRRKPQLQEKDQSGVQHDAG